MPYRVRALPQWTSQYIPRKWHQSPMEFVRGSRFPFTTSNNNINNNTKCPTLLYRPPKYIRGIRGLFVWGTNNDRGVEDHEVFAATVCHRHCYLYTIGQDNVVSLITGPGALHWAHCLPLPPPPFVRTLYQKNMRKLRKRLIC